MASKFRKVASIFEKVASISKKVASKSSIQYLCGRVHLLWCCDFPFGE
ncbi:hypothetical protein [Lysinibacillus sp. 54212]